MNINTKRELIWERRKRDLKVADADVAAETKNVGAKADGNEQTRVDAIENTV